MWIQTKTGRRAETHADIRVLLNMRGPEVLTDEVIQALGFVPMALTKPAYDPMTQVATEVAPKIINGVYTQQWEITTLNPDQVRLNLGAAVQAKTAEINAARMAANFDSFPFAGKRISTDAVSRSDIDATTGYVALFGRFPADWVGVWKATDNTYIPIVTVDDWKALYQAFFDQGQANFRHSEGLKLRLGQASNAADIAAIRW